MPPFQTSEAIRPAKGFPGMMADMAEWNANSGFAVGTTLRPGHPVQRGPAPGERSFAIFTTGSFMGILRHHITAAPQGIFAENAMIAAIDEGHMFVRPGGACTAGMPVYWLASANGGEGGYTSVTTGAVRIPGAEFHTTAVASDDVVVVNLRKLPGGAS